MVSRMKQLGSFLLFGFFCLSVFPGTTTASPKLDVLTQLEAPMGHGSLMAFTILGNFIAKADEWGFILRPQETPGFLYNIREMGQNKARWKNTVFGTEETIITLAYVAGGTPELKEFMPVKIPIAWKMLWSEGIASQGMWYITFDPELKTIADLKGKKLGLGLRTQSDWGMDATLFLNVAYGIDSKNTKLFYLGPAKMTDTLLDGKVDAICMGMAAGNAPGTKKWLPSSVYLKLKASGRKLYYIPIDPWALEKINQKYGTTYQLEKVPAGTLKDQQGELIVGADRVFIACHPDLPEDLAYRYVMAVAKTVPQIKEYHAIWKYVWNLEGMVSGLTDENTHPGAIRALKELGVWDKRKDYPPFIMPK